MKTQLLHTFTKNAEKWIYFENGNAGNELVLSKDNSVVWYTLHRTVVLKRFSFDAGKVIDLKVAFLPKDGQRYICILLDNDCMKLYSLCGKMYDVPLKVSVFHLHENKVGLLLEGKDSWFSLNHPLDQVKPVQCSREMAENVVYSSERYGMVVTCSPLGCRMYAFEKSAVQNSMNWSKSWLDKSRMDSFTTGGCKSRYDSSMGQKSKLDSTMTGDRSFTTGYEVVAEWNSKMVWEAKMGKMKNTKVFFANDVHGEAILCVFNDGRLIMFNVEWNDGLPIPCNPSRGGLECVDAVPIVCSREHPTKGLMDVLVVKASGVLELYIGSMLIGPCGGVEMESEWKRLEGFDTSMSPVLPASTVLMGESCLSFTSYDDSGCSPARGIFQTPQKSLRRNEHCKLRFVHNNMFDALNENQTLGTKRYKINLLPSMRLVKDIFLAFSNFIPMDTYLQLLTGLADVKHGETQWVAFKRLFMYQVLGFNTAVTQDSSWQRLLSSDFHIQQSSEFGNESTPDMQHKELHPDFTELFMALHLVYEDCKLQTYRMSDLEKLGPILWQMASRFQNGHDYQDHYRRDLCAYIGVPNCATQSAQNAKIPFSNELEIPSIMQCLGSTNKEHYNFPQFSDSSSTNILCEFYNALNTSAEAAVQAMANKNFTAIDLDRIPFGVAYPLRQAIYDCRQHTCWKLTEHAYTLIGREDMAVISNQFTSDRHSRQVNNLRDDHDGFKLIQQQTKKRFGRDARMREVCRLLRSSKPIYLKVQHGPEVSDHEKSAELQSRLLQLCKRSLALPVGRGMLTLFSLDADLTEALPIPNLVLTGRVPPINTSVSLESCPSDFANWPDFHNGAASGLRLRADKAKITRTWIIYNKPATPNFTHAGFLMALGIRGYLSSLAMTDLFDYMSQGHHATTVGILLGLAAANRGSMKRNLSKMLCLHIPSLFPPPFAEIQVACTAQIAAIIGVGLLYQGTGNRLMTEFLLAEIGNRPDTDRFDSRESYNLSAGISLGLVLLGCGSKGLDTGLADVRIEDRLHQYMVGGKSQNVSSKDSNKCSRLKEGDMINVQVTSAGAILALGLMFLKSNNASVASRLSVPDTMFLLDFVRPDMLLLRVLAKNLVLWDSIEATLSWVQNQVPIIIWDAMRVPSAEYDMQSVTHAYANIIAGSCFALGLRYASTCLKSAFDILLHWVSYFKKLRDTTHAVNQSSTVDRSTLESCLCISVQALALVMAGSGDITTLRTIRELRQRVDGEKIKYGHHMGLNMAIGFLFLGGGKLSIKRTDDAIAALIIALYPRYASSTTDNLYHLQALRHLYVLAVESRHLSVVDVDTKEEAYVPIEIELKDGFKYTLVAPFNLPEFDSINRVRVQSPRYYDLSFDLSTTIQFLQIVHQGIDLVVKRKAGFLPYEQDVNGSKGLLARAFPQNSGAKELQDALKAFTDDRRIRVFSDAFCSLDDDEFSTFCRAITYDCLTNEKSEALPIYVAMHHYMTSDSASTMVLQNILLILNSCEIPQNGLLSNAFIVSMNSRLKEYFSHLQFEGNRSGRQVLKQYLNTGMWPKSSSDIGKLASLLLYLQIPHYSGSRNFANINIVNLPTALQKEANISVKIALFLEDDDYY